MPDSPQTILSFAFLVPIAYTLIAVAGFPAQRARGAAVSFLLALGLAGVGYVATGFALQFGGIGLIHERPGLDGLIWEWSALGPTWGPGWGMAGLAGWGMTGPAATAAARDLALANLPWAATAVLIPVMALRGRVPAWAVALLGLLTGAVAYPLAGNWLWAGGWLANLGDNLGLAHGLVDAAGGGSIHLLGASVALAGFVLFWPRRARQEPDSLPAAHFPLLGLLGALLLYAGVVSWMSINPLVDPKAIDPGRILLNVVLASGAGALLPLGYTWLVTHRADPLMALRGFAAAVTAMLAAAPFLSPWSALAAGAVAGLLAPFLVYLVDRLLRLDDAAATLTVHGMGGAAGLLAIGIFADGTAGQGWNGVGTGEYLGVPGQGVTGLLAAVDARPAWQGQAEAQLVGLAALALFGFFVAWAVLAPPATVFHLLQPRRRPREAVIPVDIPVVADAGPAAEPVDAQTPVVTVDAAERPADWTGEAAPA